MAPTAMTSAHRPVHLAGEQEQRGGGPVGGEADRLLRGVEARERVVDEQAEGGEDDHAQPGAEVAPVDRRGEDGEDRPAFVRGVSVRAEAAQQPRADGLLHREQHRGEQDQERHELAEDALAGEEQQQPADETARGAPRG